MRRTPLLLGVAASGSLLLAGCGTAATTTGGTAADVAPAAATEVAPDLADGLLPAEDFAPGGTVVPVSGAELAAALGGLAGRQPEGLTVTPESCVTAVETAATALGDPSGDTDATGQYARAGLGGSAELLAVGGPAETLVGTLTDAVAACPTATVDTAAGQAVLTFGAVTSPDLGDAAAVVPVTVSVTPAGGAATSGSALLGVVTDGDRVLALATAGLGSAPDAAAFDALLAAAHQHAVDTVG